MKKLRNKVFLVIFFLLTTFTLLVFVTSTVRTYMERRDFVHDSLMKIPRTIDFLDSFTPTRGVPYQDSRRIFLGSTIYTILLDEDGNYIDFINYTNQEDIDEETVEELAKTIIKNHKEPFYIGNLYTNKYAYIFTNENTLIIMDNSDINQMLIQQLIGNIFLFLLWELFIFVISYYLTKWITTPVLNSFNRQKEFVADASHELKTPLSVMIASADAYFNDKNDKWVMNMKNESERMIKLVTELLDLAKTEQEQDIVMEKNHLSEIIESSILTFESLFYEQKIKLKYEIEPNIEMICNRDLMIELMSILMDNAVKHCKEKGKVMVLLYRKNRQIILEVKNTGDAIKKEDEEKIFERFYKVDSSRNRNSNHYGLGLAIAKNIVEKHEGEISAHSSDGFTTFRVTWNQK